MPAAAHRLYRKTLLPGPIEAVFDFFSRAENLGRITPPWLQFRVLTPTPLILEKQSRIELSFKLHLFSVHWETEIAEWDRPHSFIDKQIKGPYKQWEHLHRFTAQEDFTLMEDAVVYRIPGWIFEPFIHLVYVRPKLEKIFNYRGEQLNLIFQQNLP